MFNFQHSQLTQNEIVKLVDLLLIYPKVLATSKFDVVKLNSTLHLPLKPDAVFKKQRASIVPIQLHDKVNRLLDILEQYEVRSPVNKENNQKETSLLTLFLILPKETH